MIPLRSRYPKEYRAWKNMIRRTTDPRDISYKYYGPRGITVCQRWLESFDAFFEDIGPAPTHRHTLDRKENKKGYYKENCRWATKKEQQENRDMCRRLTFAGETLCLTDWAKRIGITVESLRSRLEHHMVEDALAMPRQEQFVPLAHRRKPPKRPQ